MWSSSYFDQTFSWSPDCDGIIISDKTDMIRLNPLFAYKIWPEFVLLTNSHCHVHGDDVDGAVSVDLIHGFVPLNP